MVKSSLHYFYFLRQTLVIQYKEHYFFHFLHLCVTACPGLYMHVESRSQPWVSTSVISLPSPFEVRPLTKFVNFTSSVKLAGHQDQGSNCLCPHSTEIPVYNPEIRFSGYVDL